MRMGLALILVLLIVLEVNIGLVNYCSGQSYSDLTYNDKLDSVDKNDSTWKLLTDTVSIFYGYQLKKRVSRWLESANNSSASTNSSANSTDESSLHPTSQPTYISVNTASSAMPTSTPTQEANISSSNNTILLQPSSMPTVGSSSPTSSPTYVPTILPANRSYNPSSSPSLAPNSNFSFTPTSMPTSVPSSPTSVPTSAPSTHCPSSSPSSQPTSFPSLAPTSSPTSMPTPPGIVGKNWYYTVTAQCFLLGDGVDDQYYIDEMNTAINQVFQFLLKDPLEDAQSELIDVFAVRKTALPLGRKLSSSLFHTTESSVRYDLEVWCPNHDLALQSFQVLETIQGDALLIVEPMHERNLRVVADAEILAIRLQTISGGPPETLSVDLSPSRIVAIIIGTIVIFLLGSCLLNCGVSFYRNNPEFFNNFCKNTQSLVVDWYQAISDLFHAAYNDMMNQHSHGRNGFTLADQSDDEESNQNDVTRVEMVRYKDLASDRTQDKKQSSNPIYKDKKTEDI